MIYKQYQAGFYGLSTAGNVVLFLVVTAHRLAAVLVPQPEGGGPVSKAGSPTHPRYRLGGRALVVSVVVFLVPFVVHPAHRGQGPAAVGRSRASPGRRSCLIVQNFVDVVKARDYMLVTAFINSTILTVASVAGHGRPRARWSAFVLQRRPSRLEPAASTSWCCPG